MGPPRSPDDRLRSPAHEQLLAGRMILVDQRLDVETATLVAAQLMSLDTASSDSVTLVDSPGRR